MGCFEKGWITKPSFPLCLGWNEMDINITQQVNRWVFETQIKMWVIIYPSKMIVLSIILWKYCGSWMGRIVDRLHMGIIYIYICSWIIPTFWIGRMTCNIYGYIIHELYLTHHLTHCRQLVVELEEWYMGTYIYMYYSWIVLVTQLIYYFYGYISLLWRSGHFNCCNVGNGVVNM